MCKTKDELQRWLETQCILQLWTKKQINSKIEKVKQINPYSIKSVKQRL